MDGAVGIYGIHAVIAVDDFYIFIAQVLAVPVDKPIVPAFHGIVFDAVSAHYINLHPIIRNKKMPSPAHDFVGRIIKQVINVKFKDILWRKIILEIFFPHINRRGKINIVIPEIDKTYPLTKRQDLPAGIGADGKGGIRKERAALQIGAVGNKSRGITAQTDMFFLMGQGSPVIYRPVFFLCRKHAGEFLSHNL